eukprot:TRINITY_DN42541_c0_g1_i1.p1 TRINITY_DN42541_c0_g1~~TRINITY_DN42541_c0_g1_i1.p1  ORF type:complete len:338 (-),score=29.39 TRINITY_DN42541_c0_g1_i1:24-1037(-)
MHSARTTVVMPETDALLNESNDETDGASVFASQQGSLQNPRTAAEMRRSRIDLDRRYVFLCPSTLNKHFDALPSQAKDSALLVFRCSRNFVFTDTLTERASRCKAKIDSGLHGKLAKRLAKRRPPAADDKATPFKSELSAEFVQWVLTKEKEGCVHWFKPERDLHKLSTFFEEKIDPVNEQPYRPLLLDTQWWRVFFMPSTAKYIINPAVVTACISSQSFTGPESRDMPIPALQELIYQSNPTLEPIAKWPYAPAMRYLPRPPQKMRDFGAQPSKPRGCIDFDYSRVGRWPAAPRERLDDLHRVWQVEDAQVQRHLAAGFDGRSQLPSIGRSVVRTC